MLNVYIFYLVGMFVLAFVYHYEPSDEKDIVNLRKKQAKNLLRENLVKEKLDEVIKERVKFTKRVSMEDKLVQAGFAISYTEYIMICILTAIVMSLTFGIIMTNPLLALLFLVFGFLAPYQLVAFLRNRRLNILEKQIGSFMQMVIKRYENTRDFHLALKMTGYEFKGEEPMVTEIEKTVLEIDLGVPVNVALKNMAKRTGNTYMERFAAYYEIAAEIGTDELRKNLLTQVYSEYEENRQLKRSLKKEISEPVRNAYISIIAVPMFAIYQIATNKDYIEFMTKTFVGRVGTTGIIGTLIVIMWFVNAKIGAPLD